MSPIKLEKLTPEQESLIPFYREKWRAIALSTEPIDREKATTAVQAIYTALNLKQPEIIFFDSPHAARLAVLKQAPQPEIMQQLGKPLVMELSSQIRTELDKLLEESLSSKLQQELWNQQIIQLLQWRNLMMWRSREELLTQLWERQQESMREQLLKLPGGQLFLPLESLWKQFGEPVLKQVEESVWKPLVNQPLIRSWEQQLIQPVLQIVEIMEMVPNIIGNLSLELLNLSLFDYCSSVLNCELDRDKLEAVKSIFFECGHIFTFDEVCFVSDRPTKLSLDSESRAHAEGEAAIEFKDGVKIYAYHGVRLPEKYAALHPHQWRSQWLLEEYNAELRRVLIQGIGYGRICQELQAETIDNWRDYTLLKINNDIDVEPLYLLKMTCPSTGSIYALRVPPDITSAREAICWVNWGTDPEEFSVQT